MNNPIAALLLSLSLTGSALAQEIATVTEGKVNVRGQPTLRSEVVTQLQKGESVTILERVPSAAKPKPGEPAFWAKIRLPANTPVWAFSDFLKNGEVAVARLNVRAGPGENYSVLGTLTKGSKVKEIRAVESWTEVESPEGSFAFIDASLLKTESAAPTAKPAPTPAVVAAAPAASPPKASNPSQRQGVGAVLEPARPAAVAPVPEPAAEPVRQVASAPVTNTTISASQNPGFIPAPLPPGSSSPAAAAPRTASTAAAAPSASAPLPAVAPAPVVIENATPKRLVRREGVVRITKSVQAPSWYELVSTETGKVIDYLRADSLGVDLKHAKGQRVIVTGEEGVDSRWPQTPVLELQSIETAP